MRWREDDVIKHVRIVTVYLLALPPTLLLIWSCIYLVECVKSLRGEYRSVTFSYQASDGWVTLQADWVEVGEDLQSVRADGVRVISPTGEEIAVASRLRVEPPLPWASRRLRVGVEGAEAELSRDAAGRWNYERLLPYPPREEPEVLPFTVIGRRARLSFSDDAAGDAGDWRANIEEFRVDGIGESWRLVLAGEIEGAGRLSGSVFFVDGVMREIEVSTPGIEIGRIRRYLDRTPDFQDAEWLRIWSVESGSFVGDARIQNSDKLTFHASGRAEANGLRLFGRYLTFATFSGDATEGGISGAFEVGLTGASARAVGSIGWSDALELRFDGSAFVKSDHVLHSLAGEPVFAQDLRFSDGRFEGSIEYRNQLTARGRVHARAVSYGEYEAQQVVADVVGSGTEFRFRNASGVFYDAPAQGEFWLSFSDIPQMQGKFWAPGVALDLLPNLPKEYVLGGRVDLEALVAGPVQSLRVFLNVTGTADLLLEDANESVVETVDVRSRAELSDGVLRIRAAEIVGPSGALRADGNVNFSSRSIAFNFAANSVAIGLFPSSLASGTLFAKGTVSGTWDSPKLSASAEIYDANIEGYSLSYIGTKLELREAILRLEEIDARSGVGQIQGQMEIVLDDSRSIKGSGIVNDASVRDYFSDTRVFGLASGTWTLSGTLADPEIGGRLEATNVVLDEVTANNVVTEFRISKSAIGVESFAARFGDGTVVGRGEVAFTGESRFEFEGEGLSVSVFQPYLGEKTLLGGGVSLDGFVDFSDGRLNSGRASFRIEGLSFDGVPFGSGNLEFALDGTRVTLDGAIGSLDGFFVAEAVSYNWESDAIGGTVSILNFDSDPLYTVLSEELTDYLSPQVQDLLANSSASITAGATFGGTLRDWHAQVGLNVSQIKYRDLALGVFEARASRSNQKWNIASATFEGHPLRFTLNDQHENYLEEHGSISLDGEFSRIQVDWLANLWPELSGARGTIQVPFRVSGRTDSPLIVASLDGRNVAFDQFTADALSVDRIAVSDGEIVSDGGRVVVRSLEARLLESRIPFRYPFEIPSDEPFLVLIEIPSRNLADLSRFFGGFDESATVGIFDGGSIRISGTPEDWSVSGQLSASAERVKFEDLDTELVVSKAELRMEPGNIVSIDIEGSAMQGGSFRIEGRYDLVSDSFLPGSEINIESLPVYQRFGTENSFRTVLTATGFKLAGSLLAPHVGGDQAMVRLEESILSLGGEFPRALEAQALAVDPRFTIRAIEIAGAQVRSGRLRASVDGAGFVLGSLSSPVVDVGFRVREGSISLPAQRIVLEEGGQARFRYGADFTGDVAATLDVNLQASTRATAAGVFGVQRYTITLNITGDMLSDDELRIDASSDPPDLTRDEIFAILGQRQLLETIGGSISANVESQLRAILNIAAPSILDPITRGIEAALGLDFVFVDFSHGGTGVLTVGKYLGSGFTAEYRRPLDETPRFKQIELLQLTYRPPLRRSLLSRFHLSFGLDGLGLWRVSFGYSGRF